MTILITLKIKSRDATSDETRISSIGRSKDLQLSTNFQEVENDQLESQNVPSNDEYIETSLKRSKRRRIAKSFSLDFKVYLVEVQEILFLHPHFIV